MSAGQPFGRRSVLALVAIGASAFVVLLYALGTGFAGGSGNNGGGHALSKGLTGYAALVALARSAGVEAEATRDANDHDEPGLLVLTPPHDADPAELQRIVAARRYVGPTLIVTPKWFGMPIAANANAKQGWVMLSGGNAPDWPGFHDEIGLDAIGSARGLPIRWRGSGGSGALPSRHFIQTGAGAGWVPLVRPSPGRGMLAGYLADEGSYPALRNLAEAGAPRGGDDDDLHPIILVFEPDLLDNYGLAERATALNALALLRAANAGSGGPVRFDVTLNGLGRARNLLTLAFTPPFLAATLALLLAAFAAAWRAMNRFGPPRASPRPVAYGKSALVENSAGLIRRARRLRLLGAPYAALVTARLARALGLPANARAEAIDAAQARRALPGPRFSDTAAALAEARKPHSLVRDAGALRALEKALTQ